MYFNSKINKIYSTLRIMRTVNVSYYECHYKILWEHQQHTCTVSKTSVQTSNFRTNYKTGDRV